MRGGSAKQTLLPSEKEARGSFKKPEELLTALLLRVEARELLLQKTLRPRDLGSHPRGARQTDPHARGANQKPGGPLTALSLRARDSGAPPATLPRPSSSGSHMSGLSKKTLCLNEKDVRGSNKKVGGTPDRPLAPCGGSGALPAPKIKTSDPSPLRSGGSKAGPPGFRQLPQGKRVRDDYGRACTSTPCVVSETGREVSEWDPTVGRHRAPRVNRTALGPTREALWYFWSASQDR